MQTNTGRTYFKKGMIPWNKGKKLSKEHIKNLSESHKGLESPKKGKIFPHLWKEKVKYQHLHKWVRKYKPCDGYCVDCGKKPTRIQAANISGEYKRDLEDYKWLCGKCHLIFDDRLEDVKNEGRKSCDKINTMARCRKFIL